MVFQPPTFNLTCDIYNVILPSSLSLRLSSDCNLAMGKRIDWFAFPQGTTSGPQGIGPSLLLPAGTDIRDASTGQQGDIVEVPAGSGRWYTVSQVDDVAKGFPNEYRFATISKIWNFDGWTALGIPNWPAPIP